MATANRYTVNYKAEVVVDGDGSKRLMLYSDGKLVDHMELTDDVRRVWVDKFLVYDRSRPTGVGKQGLAS